LLNLGVRAGCPTDGVHRQDSIRTVFVLISSVSGARHFQHRSLDSLLNQGTDTTVGHLATLPREYSQNRRKIRYDSSPVYPTGDKLENSDRTIQSWRTSPARNSNLSGAGLAHFEAINHEIFTLRNGCWGWIFYSAIFMPYAAFISDLFSSLIQHVMKFIVCKTSSV
jgi:hypothetical protein